MALFQRPTGEKVRQVVRLTRYAPELKLTSLVPGVDNVRHDVQLSAHLVSLTSQYVFHLLLKHSGATSLLEDSVGVSTLKPADRNEFKRLVQELLLGALAQARAQQNQELDLLANLALFKYLAGEMQRQYGILFQQGKNKLRRFEGPKYENDLKVLVLKQSFGDFQTQKKIFLRLVATDLQRAVNEVQADVVRKTRESYFGPESGPWYNYFSNPLAFTENGRDDFIHLEKYVLSGNFQRDPDRYQFVEEWLRWFFQWVDEAGPEARELALHKEKQKQLTEEMEALKQSQNPERKGGLGRLFGGGATPAAALPTAQLSQRIEALLQQMLRESEAVQVQEAAYQAKLGDVLNAPENAEELFGASGTEQQLAELRRRNAPRAEIAALEEKLEIQRYLLDELYKSAQQAGLPPYVAACYEAARIYNEFCPPINPQNLKQALLNAGERKKVADLVTHYKMPEARLAALEEAAARVRAQGGRDLRGLLARFVTDYLRHHHDARLLEVLQGLLERIHLAFEEKTIRLSRINGTLYAFLLPDEEQPASERVTGHVILKADVRDSTRLTAELLARGLNPASYFSLNFYDPLNRILPRYGAEKVFIEGDAVILALFEKEGGAGHAVALACGLAREMMEIVRLYNSKGEGSGLPPLEIGIGICWRSAPPLYLLDGETRIMISDALNLSDRLSGCSKLARRSLPHNTSPFNVYLFQTITEEAAAGAMEEFLVRYNVNGICLDEEAFEKLRQEISFTRLELELPLLWGKEKVVMHYGSVPVSQDVFQRLVVRESQVPFVETQNFGLLEKTRRRYFEVCTNKIIYEHAESSLSSAVAHSS